MKPTRPAKPNKPSQFIKTICLVLLVFLIGAYIYTVPISIRQLAAAGFVTWEAVLLGLLTSALAIFFVTLAVGLAACIGITIGLVLIQLWERSDRRHS